MRFPLHRFWLILLLLAGFSAHSQTSSAKLVCLSVPEAARLLDSLRRLPAVRGEAREWHLAYEQARRAAGQDSLAAQHYHADLRRGQAAFASQQVLLEAQWAETQKFRVRAHRKGWVLAALLGGLALLAYLP